MGVADEQIEKIRWKRQAERTLKDDDFSVKLFSFGWFLFLAFSLFGVFSFAFGYFLLMRWIFPPSDGYGSVVFAVQSGLIAFFGGLPLGQLIAVLILRALGKRWRGNLHFGKHPVFFIILASWLSFNICFVLLLSLILSFK